MAEAKISVSPLQDGAIDARRRDRVFQAWRREKTRSLPCRTELPISGEETEFFSYGGGKNLDLYSIQDQARSFEARHGQA
jgi:hypothetical protein